MQKWEWHVHKKEKTLYYCLVMLSWSWRRLLVAAGMNGCKRFCDKALGALNG